MQPPDLCSRIGSTSNGDSNSDVEGERSSFRENGVPEDSRVPPTAIRASSSPVTSGMENLSLPLFSGTVKRSTRFSTSVPAAEVLRLIDVIVRKNELDIPALMSGQVQRTDIDWEAYKLNIVVGSVTLCTVRASSS